MVGEQEAAPGIHHRYLRRFRVLDCFDGLRHHTVVGSNNQDYDVRCLRTTSTH